ncbi:pseudouridine synthase [Ramlibacter sp. WS9]|uniref:pseudouridine synthase n=1 Tax=Ramlibacter sp. WS9 TaxID=1882741 RepID=UPI001143DB81|nr:pseudouridine synthase [Ramlibacter sp. WS9]ROZ71331.1 RNA pseudouridine synthase [Ramlibacter sp. WS9]
MRKLSDADTGGHGLSLLHADTHLLVFDKPSGLLSVPGRGADKQDCMAARAQRAYPDALVVHRLDMATSGLWLMARGADMQRRMSSAFAQREVGKRYAAVVTGRLETPASSTDGWSLIDLPLAADWPNRPRRVVDHEHGKPSQTRWRVLESALGAGGRGGTTRLELEPLTGRSHQLRVHLQALGHPIVGDTLYAPAEVQAQSPRLLLHATGLRFTHPATGEALAFSSACPF